MEYLLKASAVIAVFYMFYKLLLQRDTFFRCNRWFLLVGLLVSLTIPMVVIPIYIEYIPVDVSNFTFENATNPANSGLEMSDYVMIVYGLGVTFFFTRFLIQVTSLALVIMRHKKDKRGKYTYVKTQANISPFSFFRWIVFNPEKFNNTELEQIIAHEKVHVNQYHSMDILLTHLACIVLWVNPFIWLYKKDLKQNLEFLADHDTVNNAVCKKAYQYTLLKTSAPSHQLALSNNFYNSLIKKRIVMLQKSKSKKINQFKYALVIPLLAIFLMSFNTKEMYVEKHEPVNDILPNTILDVLESREFEINEKPIVKTNSNKKANLQIPTVNNYKSNLDADKELVEYIITKTTSDTDLDKLTEKVKNKDITLKFKGVKRNANDEIIAIKIDTYSKDSNANYQISSDEGIAPIRISFGKNGKNISIGNGIMKKNVVTYIIKDGDRVHKVKKSGKGTKAIFISDDGQHNVFKLEGDSVHFITDDEDENTLTKRIKKVEVIKNGENDGVVEIIVDNDGVNEEEDIIIVKKNKHGKAYKVKTIGKENDSKKIVIKTDDGTEPLFIINGKIVDGKDIKTLDSDDIKTVNVLKGDAALKKYGDKAKNGVVEITTKN